jgi:glycosyltransferase involved in cell wall biosynthesis
MVDSNHFHGTPNDMESGMRGNARTLLAYYSGPTSPSIAKSLAVALSCKRATVDLIQLGNPRSHVIGLHDALVEPMLIPSRKKPKFLRRLFNYYAMRAMEKAIDAEKYDVYVTTNLELLPAMHNAAQKNRARLVYVPSEYYPHLSYGSRSLRKRYADLEREFAPKVDVFVAFGSKVVEEYADLYKIPQDRFTVFYMGQPEIADRPTSRLRSSLGLTDDRFVLLYQGLIVKQRGVHQVVEALQYLPKHVVFVVLGMGKEISRLKREALGLGVSERLHIVPTIAQSELVSYSSGADVGIIPILNVCRSYYYCNPGKIFEFMASALPLAVSNLAQLSDWVETRHLGVIFDPEDPKDIAAKLLPLIDDKNFRETCGRNSRKTHLEETQFEQVSARLRKAVYGL